MASKFMANALWGLVFSFDHFTSALFGPSTSLKVPSLANPRRRFSNLGHTQTLLPLPLLPFQNPPDLRPFPSFQNPPVLLPFPPFQNPPGYTEGSQSSGHEDKN